MYVVVAVVTNHHPGRYVIQVAIALAFSVMNANTFWHKVIHATFAHDGSGIPVSTVSQEGITFFDVVAVLPCPFLAMLPDLLS